MTEQLTAAAAPSTVGGAEGAGETGVALLLRRLEHQLGQRLQPVLAEHSLTGEHWQVLAVLLARPGVGMSELAASAVLPAATLTRHMDRLVERALVVRRIDPDDKRRVVAALSPRGLEIARTIRAAERRIEEDWAAQTDDSVRQAVAALLRQSSSAE